MTSVPEKQVTMIDYPSNILKRTVNVPSQNRSDTLIIKVNPGMIANPCHPGTQRLRQKQLEFEASRGYTVSLRPTLMLWEGVSAMLPGYTVGPRPALML